MFRKEQEPTVYMIGLYHLGQATDEQLRWALEDAEREATALEAKAAELRQYAALIWAEQSRRKAGAQ